MIVRLGALACLGIACCPPLGQATCAAAESGPVANVAAFADAGSSSREMRARAARAVPLEHMAAADRALAEQAIRQATLHRRLPQATVACDAALLDFVLTRPETLVDVWRVLGISRLALDPTGPGRWRMADGYGTVGTVRLLHHERQGAGGLCVFHGRGGYDGPLSPKQLTGSCLVVVRHAPDPAAPAGRPRQTVQIDAFLDVDGLGLEIVTRTLQPLIVHSAASNLHEISLFVSQFSAAAARNPAAVARLTERMTRTDPQARRTLVALASGRTTHTAGEPHDDEDVHAELAARWMTADQLDGVRR